MIVRILLEEQTQPRDGGGVGSEPNWISGRPAGHHSDWLAQLRELWSARIHEMDLLNRCKQQLFKVPGEPSPFRFSESECDLFRKDLFTFLEDNNIPHWGGVTKGQPIWLGLLHGLLHSIGDVDKDLAPLLAEGVSIGFDKAIKGPGVWLPETRQKTPQPLRANTSNWQSAYKDLTLTSDLVRMEVEQGWLVEWRGSWQDAQERWGDKLAVSKIAVVTAEGKDPRLVIDATSAGVNPSCSFPERVQYPSIRDISNTMADYYACNSEPLWAITLDVKAAHKRVLVSESMQNSQ